MTTIAGGAGNTMRGGKLICTLTSASTEAGKMSNNKNSMLKSTFFIWLSPFLTNHSFKSGLVSFKFLASPFRKSRRRCSFLSSLRFVGITSISFGTRITKVVIANGLPKTRKNK